MSEYQDPVDLVRRSFILKSCAGIGALTLAELMGMQVPVEAQEAGSPAPGKLAGILGAGHFPARAKRVIYLHMLGAISHVDTFDYKPMLEKMHGQDLPASVRNTQRLSTMTLGQTAFPIVGPLAKFKQCGKSGIWMSDVLPRLSEIADELCVIKTMHTEHVNHDPAAKFLHTGFQLAGRPSNGAWVSYGLGSDNTNLPNYVVMTSGPGAAVPLDQAVWSSGFLPSHHQGVKFRSDGEPVLYVNNPSGINRETRRSLLDALGGLAKSQQVVSKDPEVLSRMSQYEMGYRMQASVPEIADISNEPESVLDMYGPTAKQDGTFGRNCLLARRLAERNVKFITLFHQGWDMHADITKRLGPQCAEVDQPAAALVKDLKQRGLLEDTLVVFGSEFGRTPFAQGALTPGFGRDHHGGCFTWWMAGGGVKAGYSHGETDDFSYSVAKDPVHIHDFNATLLYILGIDHERLRYRYQGRDFKLTDVAGKVVKEVLA